MATNPQIEFFVKGLKNQFNMAFAAALDSSRDFSQAYKLFREPIDALKAFQCESVAVEQLMNFAQMAYVRGEAGYAVECLTEARDLAEQDDLQTKVRELSRSMGIDLLARAIPARDEALLQVVARILSPEDYVQAMSMGQEQAASRSEEGESYRIFLRGLAMEMLRQGIIAQRAGNIPDAALLMREALPYLSVKRAEVVRQQLQTWEEKV